MTIDGKDLVILLVGAGLGIFSSLCAWYFVAFFLRPKIKLLNYFCCSRGAKKNNILLYRFKVWNSSWRQVTNLGVEVRIVKYHNIGMPNQRIVLEKVLERSQVNNGRQPHLSYLSGRKKSYNALIDSPVKIFSFPVDASDKSSHLESYLESGHHILFVLSATDSLSNSTIVISRLFDISHIKYGDFSTGISDDYIPWQPDHR